jgi:putative FmdB family regulatory protein
MPIYEYRCQDCGFQKEHLQKMNDAPLAACPSCGSASYTKLLSAAGFQLKGSGWYATDFKGGSTGAAAPPKPAGGDSSPAPAAACAGGGCACH